MAETIKSLQQQRATLAWNNVVHVETTHDRTSDDPEEAKRLKAENEKFKKEYCSLVRGLPAMILQNGLGQCVAFLKAKGENDPAAVHSVVLQDLTDGVRERLAIPEGQQMLPWLLSQPTPTYRRATSESLAYLHWLKRFVEAKDWNSNED